MSKKAALAGVLLLAALLPSAAASANPPIPTPDPTNPTVTIAPLLPLEATPADRDNLRAIQRKNGWSEHFQCRDYPADEDLQQADLVPTGNVSFRIDFDKQTGNYEVTSVDPRVNDISLREDTTRVKLGDKPWEPRHRVIYSWTLPENVEFYGIFLLRERDGEMVWRSLDPSVDPEVNGVYEVALTREGMDELPSVLFIGTDKTNCKSRNLIPDEVWTSIGLNPTK